MRLNPIDRDVRRRQDRLEVGLGDLAVGGRDRRVVADGVAVVGAPADAAVRCLPGARARQAGVRAAAVGDGGVRESLIRVGGDLRRCRRDARAQHRRPALRRLLADTDSLADADSLCQDESLPDEDVEIESLVLSDVDASADSAADSLAASALPGVRTALPSVAQRVQVRGFRVVREGRQVRHGLRPFRAAHRDESRRGDHRPTSSH